MRGLRLRLRPVDFLEHRCQPLPGTKENSDRVRRLRNGAGWPITRLTRTNEDPSGGTVTPEVAGSSPVAPASKHPADRPARFFKPTEPLRPSWEAFALGEEG